MFRPGAVFVFYGKVDEYNGYKKDCAAAIVYTGNISGFYEAYAANI